MDCSRVGAIFGAAIAAFETHGSAVTQGLSINARNRHVIKTLQVRALRMSDSVSLSTIRRSLRAALPVGTEGRRSPVLVRRSLRTAPPASLPAGDGAAAGAAERMGDALGLDAGSSRSPAIECWTTAGSGESPPLGVLRCDAERCEASPARAIERSSRCFWGDMLAVLRGRHVPADENHDIPENGPGLREWAAGLS